MYEILRVKKTTLARMVLVVATSVYVAMGLIVTLLYSTVRTLLLDGFLTNAVGVWSFFLLWLAGLIAVIPLSFLVGILAAAIYNLNARWWGGIKVDLAKVEVKDEREATPMKTPPLKKQQRHANENL